MWVELWDKLEEQLAVLVIEESMSFTKAIALTCKHNPNVPARCLMLATASLAAHFDTGLIAADSHRERASCKLNKVAVLLAVDISALTGQSPTCLELWEFWLLSEDKVFLRSL